ncbi:MAG: AAA family ATPase [Bacteroidales bacterium]
MIAKDVKNRIIAAIKQRREHYKSDAAMSKYLGINSAQYSRIMGGELEGVIAEPRWIALARTLGVELSNAPAWVTAKTPVFNYITQQLAFCQQHAQSGLLCDMADIGKTHTAVEYARTHKNAVYIDCSQVKSKQKLIRKIAKEMGLGSTARYADVYAELVDYLNVCDSTPIVILDEFGDLDYPAFLECKALWNATEGACAWYAMGADGLRAKMERNLNAKKIGYAEILSRFGVHDERVKTTQRRFQKVSPDGKDAVDEFVKAQVALIAKANGIEDVQRVYAKTGGSLRRIRIEAKKLNAVAA